MKLIRVTFIGIAFATIASLSIAGPVNPNAVVTKQPSLAQLSNDASCSITKRRIGDIKGKGEKLIVACQGENASAQQFERKFRQKG